MSWPGGGLLPPYPWTMLSDETRRSAQRDVSDEGQVGQDEAGRETAGAPIVPTGREPERRGWSYWDGESWA